MPAALLMSLIPEPWFTISRVVHGLMHVGRRQAHGNHAMDVRAPHGYHDTVMGAQLMATIVARLSSLLARPDDRWRMHSRTPGCLLIVPV